MPPHIDSYSFGSVTIDGTSYDSDLIVCPDGVRPDWWRKEGHGLCPEDLSAVIEVGVELLIVGCGAYGVLKVPETTREWLEGKGIELVALPTGEACERYNELAAGRKVAAGLHLTC